MNLFGIFLLMFSGLLAAQIPVSRPSTVAFTAGANRSWTAPLPLVRVEDGGGSSPVVRMRAGAEVTMPVRQRFALQFGAAYSQTGEFSSYLENFIEGPLIENRWELDYLELSALGRMEIPYESKRMGLHVLAGPAIALPLACRTGREADQRLGDCRPTSSRFNVLLYGGAGVDARLNERLGATAGFLYGLSLRGFTGGSDHLRVLSLRAGVAYRVN